MLSGPLQVPRACLLAAASSCQCLCCERCLHVALHTLLLPSTRPSGRAGVPMEVMGLMLGEFVDDYTVKVGRCMGVCQLCQLHVQLICNRKQCP